MEQVWSIEMLGRFRLRQRDRTINRFRTQRAAGILAYLAYHRRTHSREALMDLFWPEAELLPARHNLSQALSSLRHQLEPPGVPAGSVLVADRYSVELNPEAFTTDVVEFEQALRHAAQAQEDALKERHLLAAVERYGGPLLPSFYEEWVVNEQARLAERFVEAVRHLVRLLSGRGEPAQALELGRRAIAVDPLREDLHAEVMRLLAAAGQPAAALEQYRELERLLEQELGAPPGPAVQRLARQLQEQQLQERNSELPAVGVRPAGPPAPAAPALPTGTVTFLLTDIEGSTGRWEREGETFRELLGLHHSVLRREFRRHEGHEVKEAGDSFVAAFAGAGDALACAVAAQRSLRGQSWPGGAAPPKVRMALHAGDVELEDGEYRGLTLHRAARILSAAHGGQVLLSEAVFGLLRRDLETEVWLQDLGLYHLRDVEVPERLFQVEYAGMEQAEFPPQRADRAHRSNLPLQVTRFFGREREIETLATLFAPGAAQEIEERISRLSTLTGPGGTGKTRLAIEVARRLVEAYSGAVWFVALADVVDPRVVPETILAAMGEEPSTDRPALQQAVELLRRQPTLVVLDNLEHLLGDPEERGEAAEAVQWLLERVPDLVLLVTSRQVLGLPGEREFPVLPLPTPGRQPGRARGRGDEEPLTAEGLTLYESVRLFIDRAQAVKPDFEVTSRNAPALAEICSRLEGIPLAIELAAARAQVLTPTQILQQLAGERGGRFDLLVSRRRGVAERQRALRSTIDWSYRLLAPPLQDFFARLYPFRGGWSVEAAEAVCEDPLALDDLTQLRECSLLQTEEGPACIRFRMLETLREYARDQLSPEERAVAERRHAEYFLTLAEEAETGLRSDEQTTWLERLEADHDNLRAALRTFLHPGVAEPRPYHASALRLCSALWNFWSIRGHLEEGRRAFAEVLTPVPAGHPELGHSALRARALTGAGVLAFDQSDYAAARRLLEESVALCRELALRPEGAKESGLGQALICLANLGLDEGRPQDAMPLYEEALELYRREGDPRGVSIALSNLGVLYLERGEVDRAAELLEESIVLKRKLRNPYGLAMSLESLGNLERSRGNRERALELCREALELRQGLGHRLGIAMSLNNLGHLLLETGDAEGARTRLRESLEVFLELEEPRGAIEAATGLAGTLAATGCHEEAARLMGAMEARREASGFDPRPCEKVVIRRWRDEVRSALQTEAFEAARQEGRTLSLDEAFRLALG